MCEINPKHSAFFRLEAFTSNPDMTEAEFTNEVMQRLFDTEQQLNADGRFRFHIHEQKKGLVTLTLTEKQAAAVHALYSVGADLIFARVDPTTLKGAVGIITQFERSEVHEMRDKITALADDISDEVLTELGITRIPTPC